MSISVPVYNHNLSQLYRYGVSKLAIDTGNGTAIFSSSSGARACMGVDALTPLVNGADVEVAFSSMRCYVATATASSVKLVVIRCPVGKVPSDAGSGWTYVTSVETLVSPITATAVVTASTLSQLFTWDTAYNYYMGWCVHGTGSAFQPMRCPNGGGAISAGTYKWEIADASLVGGLPAEGTAATVGALYALQGQIKIRTKSRIVYSVADASAVSQTYRLWMPDYETAAGDNFSEYPLIMLTGAKPGNAGVATPLKFELKSVPAGLSALVATATFSLTADGASSACVFGDGAGASVALPADTVATDLFNVALSFNPRNSACEAFVDNMTGRGAALSAGDAQCFCHSEENTAAAYSPTLTLPISDAGYLVITGGPGSRTGAIQIGHEPVMTTGDSQFAGYLKTALATAFTYDRIIIPVAVSGSCLTRDTATITAIPTRFSRGWDAIRGAIILIGSGGYNDIGLSDMGTVTKAQAALCRYLAVIATMVESATMLDSDFTRYNKVVVVTPFYGDVSVSASCATYFPEYCRALMDLARRCRCTGVDLFELAHLHDDWTSDHVHPTSAGATSISAVIAWAYESGCCPVDPGVVAGDRLRYWRGT